MTRDTASPGAGSSTPPPLTPSPNPAQDLPSQKPSSELEEEDNTARAEKVKELGNTAFKAGRYANAIEYYTKAIGQ